MKQLVTNFKKSPEKYIWILFSIIFPIIFLPIYIVHNKFSDLDFVAVFSVILFFVLFVISTSIFYTYKHFKISKKIGIFLIYSTLIFFSILGIIAYSFKVNDISSLYIFKLNLLDRYGHTSATGDFVIMFMIMVWSFSIPLVFGFYSLILFAFVIVIRSMFAKNKFEILWTFKYWGIYFLQSLVFLGLLFISYTFFYFGYSIVALPIVGVPMFMFQNWTTNKISNLEKNNLDDEEKVEVSPFY